MKRNCILLGVAGAVLLIGSINCFAENWVNNNYDNEYDSDKNIHAIYHDADSVKVKDNTLYWTEKYEFTTTGSNEYSKRISKYKACQEGVSKKGNVTQLQLDYQIANGKFRITDKRNYNKNNELICSGKDTPNDFDTTWRGIKRGTPIEETYYKLVTKYKVKIF